MACGNQGSANNWHAIWWREEEEDDDGAENVYKLTLYHHHHPISGMLFLIILAISYVADCRTELFIHIILQYFVWQIIERP